MITSRCIHGRCPQTFSTCRVDGPGAFRGPDWRCGPIYHIWSSSSPWPSSLAPVIRTNRPGPGFPAGISPLKMRSLWPPQHPSSNQDLGSVVACIILNVDIFLVRLTTVFDKVFYYQL